MLWVSSSDGPLKIGFAILRPVRWIGEGLSKLFAVHFRLPMLKVFALTTSPPKRTIET